MTCRVVRCLTNKRSFDFGAADLDSYEKGVLTEFVQLDGGLRSLAALGLFTGITSGNQPVFVFSLWPKINILVDIF